MSRAAPGTTARSKAQALRRAAAIDRALSIILPLLALLVLFVFWQFFVVWRNISSFIFPRLDDTLHALGDNWSNISASLFTTLEEAGAGFAVFSCIRAGPSAPCFLSRWWCKPSRSWSGPRFW
jgi:ABC-type nitrate/sulfonate/bicarbonate transport system permease component